jgi:hypothetical protein
MQRASHIDDHARGGFAALWTWLRRATSRIAHEPVTAAREPIAAAPGNANGPAVLLQFPLRGEALLVRLAELLRRRVDELVPRCDRLLLSLSHHPALRLSIDDDAYVQFDAHSAEFNLVIEAPGGTRMIIQSADFDAVVKFVLQYVVEKLSGDDLMEAAS